MVPYRYRNIATVYFVQHGIILVCTVPYIKARAELSTQLSYVETVRKLPVDMVSYHCGRRIFY
jgi:hypothetical protein